MKAKKNKNKAYDLYGEICQSSANKVLGSVSYPFTAFEHRENFPGCTTIAAQKEGAFYTYTASEAKKMLADCVKYVKTASSGKRVPPNSSINFDLYSAAGSLVEQAKKALDVANESPKDYEGPSKKRLQAIVDGGIEGLWETLGDFEFYAWCPYLRVIVKQRPQLKLASPRIDLTGVLVEVTATGELWWKHPWFNCYRWCTKWDKVIKCDKIGSITVSPDLRAEAHANVEADGTRVKVRAEFDRLRLAYKILEKIPLEGIANRKLRDKLIYVYDAAQLVATIPVLQSKFAVSSIALPSISNGIGVEVTIRQV